MSKPEPPGLGLENIGAGTLDELLRRFRDIDKTYRAVAEEMGQLYMFADANEATTLTRRLDQPMKSASQNEQAFAAILEELQALVRRPGRTR